MRYLTLLAIILFWSCNSNNQTDNHNKYAYPGLGELLDVYYRDYYSYPQSISELIAYINTNKFHSNFDTTIIKLKRNKDIINLEVKTNRFLILLEDSIIYETGLRTPCEEFDYNQGFYLGRVLCFDVNMNTLNSEKNDTEFKAGLKEIKMLYSKAEKEEGVNKYVMIKYTKLDGLTLFCDSNIDLIDYDYFNKVEEYLTRFSDKHKITAIIFTTPILYN